MTFFDSLTLLPEDPILSLPIAFAADHHEKKVNLGVGTYKDAEGKPYVLDAVRKAEDILIRQKLNKEYLPIEGSADFLKEASKLIFGSEVEAFRAQALGGTGALRLGAEFLVQETSKTIFLSEPSWPNHHIIFSRGGMKIHTYKYYDDVKHQVDFSGMCHSIQEMAPGSVILLHASCHNPTGIDPSFEQWKELSEIIKKQRVIPFFDFAYQGFGEGIEQDAQAIRYFYEQGHEMLIASSYSKNFGLYGDRVGMLTVITSHKESLPRIGSQIKQAIRGIYSTPPLEGARLVSLILKTPELKATWEHELANMRLRIQEMRSTLAADLMEKGDGAYWSFLKNQKGMFSYAGFSESQVQKLIKDYGIYMLSNGRISIPGLNPRNMDDVVSAFLAVSQT